MNLLTIQKIIIILTYLKAIFFALFSLYITHLQKNSIKDLKFPVHIIEAKTSPLDFLKVPIIKEQINDIKHIINI